MISNLHLLLKPEKLYGLYLSVKNEVMHIYFQVGTYSVTILGDAAFTANIPPIAALAINTSLLDNLSMVGSCLYL